MNPHPVLLPCAEATVQLSARMAAHLRSGDCVTLSGPLGAGKTALARAAIQALMAEGGAREEVPSPTYTLVQLYETRRGAIWHADLFRLGSAEEVLELGLDEAFTNAITFVEWPERLGPFLPARRLEIILEFGAQETARKLTFCPVGPGWEWVKELAA